MVTLRDIPVSEYGRAEVVEIKSRPTVHRHLFMSGYGYGCFENNYAVGKDRVGAFLQAACLDAECW
jgi:hypothetical protein